MEGCTTWFLVGLAVLLAIQLLNLLWWAYMEMKWRKEDNGKAQEKADDQHSIIDSKTCDVY